MRTWIKTIVDNFAISNYAALILGVYALSSDLKLICKYELYILPNKKVIPAKVHDKNYIKVRPLLFRHRLRNCLLVSYLFFSRPAYRMRLVSYDSFALLR